MGEEVRGEERVRECTLRAVAAAGTFRAHPSLESRSVRGLTPGAPARPPARTRAQSLIVPSPSAPLFGTHPLLALVASYLDASLPAPPAQPSPRRVLRALSRLRLRSSAPSQLSLSPAHHVLLFLENPLGREFLLRLTVHASAQNRARQRRWGVKILRAEEGVGEGEEEEGWSRKVQEGFKPAWEGVLPKLVQECAADEVDDGAPSPSPSPSLRAALERFPTLLARALERQRARFALEAHLSGFEDELVGVFEACDEEEKCAGWWVGERLARALLKSQGAERAKGDIGGGGKAEEEEEEEETRAIATLCRTSRLVSLPVHRALLLEWRSEYPCVGLTPLSLSSARSSRAIVTRTPQPTPTALRARTQPGPPPSCPGSAPRRTKPPAVGSGNITGGSPGSSLPSFRSRSTGLGREATRMERGR